MTLLDDEKREFTPGTPGWSAKDLLDPEIEVLWELGSYEIVEGVLTIVPPAQFASSSSLLNLLFIVTRFMEESGIEGQFGIESDFIISSHRVARTDAMLLMKSDFPRHRRTSQSSKRYKRKGRIGRITQPPTLVVELISLGHEHHDRVVKRRWYEESGVPHFWILDEISESLECYRHDGEKFVVDAKGKGPETVRPSLFKGLSIPLSRVWI